MKRNIAIVAGGDTSEIVVSLRSAQGIYSFIDKEKYNLYIVEMEGRRWEVQLPDGNKVPVDRNDFSFTNGTEKVVFDFAYITIHGTPGEDGRLQGYFDMMRIPYSCCGVLAGALTYDKVTCISSVLWSMGTCHYIRQVYLQSISESFWSAHCRIIVAAPGTIDF